MNNRSGIASAVLLVTFLLGGCAGWFGDERPRNLIVLISDGCGPSGLTMTREFKRLMLGDGQLVIDPYLVGTVQTFPADTRIADSAASGTAYGCGIKTNKGAVGVDTAGLPVGTLLEAAEQKGLWTGVISTSGITDATPAAFTAHSVIRENQTQIAADQIRNGFDLLLGGGRIYFQRQEDGGARKDGEDQIEAARNLGYQVVANRDELLMPVRLPLLGLFADDHMALEIDRDETDQPSLSEMVTVALDLLSKSEDGFILIVETEGTDDAFHDNDTAAGLRELLSYEEATRIALEFARQDGRTLVIATSDHDAGGMSVGIGGYEWNPEQLIPIETSAARFTAVLRERLRSTDSWQELSAYVRSEMDIRFGFSDLSDEQWNQIDAMVKRAFENDRNPGSISRISNLIKEEVSLRTRIGWTTGGHTAIDVNLYAYGPGRLLFGGNLDNAVVGRRFAEVMGLDLDAVTVMLNANLNPQPGVSSPD